MFSKFAHRKVYSIDVRTLTDISATGDDPIKEPSCLKKNKFFNSTLIQFRLNYWIVTILIEITHFQGI